jgi:GTP-binding protein
VLDLVLEVADARERRIATAEVNEVLRGLVDRNAPPQQIGEPVRLLYASQINIRPPTFAIVSNRPEAIPEAYQRYLVRGFRQAWGFIGAPIRVKYNRRGGRG